MKGEPLLPKSGDEKEDLTAIYGKQGRSILMMMKMVCTLIVVINCKATEGKTSLTKDTEIEMYIKMNGDGDWRGRLVVMCPGFDP